METQSMLPVGTLLQGGKYRIERYLSSGGFGNTYVANIVEFDEEVAVKEFYMKGVNERGDDSVTVTVGVRSNTDQFTGQREKFKKEARRLRKLKHPHIVPVHDLFEENGTAYYVMDLIRGESVADRMKRMGQPLTEQETVAILTQVLDALSVVHNQGMYHLDIKPANIMMDADGCAKLIDFGASKQMHAGEGVSLFTSSAMTYTPGYAPLEQQEQNAKNLGPWTDIYALGATLYKMLTNQTPPSASELLVAREPLSYPPAVSQQMRQLIEWMMKPRFDERPQSIGEVKRSLTPDPSPKEERKSLTPDPSPKERGEVAPSLSEETEVLAPQPQQRDEETEMVNPQPEMPPAPVVSKKKPPVALYAGIGAVVLVLLVGFFFLLMPTRDTGMDGQTSVEQKDVKDNETETVTVNGVSFRMIGVQGGTFTMGATSEQGSDAFDDEKPVHQVTLSSFSIGETEVTQELWQAVMGSNPSYFKGARRPVEQVSWEDCQDFIRRLNSLTGRNFRLPTEAEWEYAARGGNRSNGYKYAGGSSIGDVAWYTDNSSSTTHDVGTKRANELGLYDMSGNVWEWCQDWYGSYSSGSQTNPRGASSGSYRVNRGGCWATIARGCRVSNRCNDTLTSRNGSLGMRLAL